MNRHDFALSSLPHEVTEERGKRKKRRSFRTQTLQMAVPYGILHETSKVSEGIFHTNEGQVSVREVKRPMNEKRVRPV